MSLTAIFGFAILAYILSVVFEIFKNWRKARVLGFPLVIVPVVQDNPFWMILGVPIRPLLERYLPTILFDRLSITIYGWENKLRFYPYKTFSTPFGSPKSFSIVGGSRIELSTWDQEIVSEILRRPKDFQQFDTAKVLLNTFGDNVLSTDGEIWARHRKLVASVVNERISSSVFSQATSLTKGIIDEVFEGSPPGALSAETDHLFDMVKKLAITVLVNSGMGGNRPWKDPKKVVKPGFKLTYIEAVKAVIDNFPAQAVIPRWFMASYPPFLPGYDTMRLLSYAVGEFRTHTADLIDEEKKRSATAGTETRNNILSMLLNASKEGKSSTNGGGYLTEDEIMGNLFIFTIAGFDTTTNTTAYALVRLVQNPRYQEWLFEEIDRILPSDPEAVLDYASIFPKAQRCLALMMETLRLHPSIIHITKMTQTTQTIKTSRHTFQVPARTIMLINCFGAQHDPDVWRDLNKTASDETREDVEDEFVFRPSRWINAASPETENTSSKLFSPPKGSFIAWSMGPRVCPGQKMAQVEFVGFMLMLLRYHRVEAVKIKMSDGKGGVREETDRELDARITAVIENSICKVSQEMDVFGIRERDTAKTGQRRGLGMRLVRR